MQIVKVNIKKDLLCFSYFSNSKGIVNFINSNNEYKNELLYSFSYAIKNVNKVREAMCKMVDKKSVNGVVFESNEIAEVFLGSIMRLDFPINVNIKEEMSISYLVYQQLLKIKKLKSVKCYFMPENYVRVFGNRKVSVYFSFNSAFSNDFVRDNELENMKNIYYKRNIVVKSETLNDFKLFLTINRHLKIIHIYKYKSGLVRDILNIVNKDKYVILIHQRDEDLKALNMDLGNLKKLKKAYRKSCRGEVRIVYEDEYVKSNLFRQLTYGNLKVCSIIIIYMAFVLLISNTYNDYVTWFNSNIIMNSISSQETVTSEILVPGEEDAEIVDEGDEEEEVDPYASIPKEFDALLEMNSDTVGWITVNNTKINYPVVQSSDNDYYLNRDFYERRTANGWIFMDYRNDWGNLNKNTIIYGHSLLSGYMFGDLDQTIKSSWYKNEENLIITFNTLNKEMKWEVFSIYRTPYTTDYLKVNFYDDKAFLDFASLIKDRSVYNFGVKINKHDYILTLSTCVGNEDDRLVMHAKLVQD